MLVSGGTANSAKVAASQQKAEDAPAGASGGATNGDATNEKAAGSEQIAEDTPPTLGRLPIPIYIVRTLRSSR